MISDILLFALTLPNMVSATLSSAAACTTGCGPSVCIFPDTQQCFGEESSDVSPSFFRNPCPSPNSAAGYFELFFTADVFKTWSDKVLFPPLGVHTANYLRDGPIISKYRKCIARKNRKALCANDLKDPFIVCTRRSKCSGLLSKARFIAAVVDTIKIISGNPDLCVSDRALVVIANIYDSAVGVDASIEQLVNFTSIALHNVYLFTCFPSPNVWNVCIGDVTRGLLQLKSLIAYERITDISCHNYIERPYLLDTFSSSSIRDEFRLFVKYYSDSSYGVGSFISSVHLLESQEAPLVNRSSAVEVLIGVYVPRDVLQARVLRRFNIYYVLLSQIFAGAPRSVSAVSIRSY